MHKQQTLHFQETYRSQMWITYITALENDNNFFFTAHDLENCSDP